MAKPEAILRITPKNGKPIFDNRYDSERFFLEKEGISLICEIREESKLSEKQKMFNYLFGPLAKCAARGWTFAGWEGVDPVKAIYMLQAEFAKEQSYNKITKEIKVTPESLAGMSKSRLLKFITDCIYFLEIELKQTVPDSAEYKAMKGDGFMSVKHTKISDDLHICDGCNQYFYEDDLFHSFIPKEGHKRLCSECNEK